MPEYDPGWDEVRSVGGRPMYLDRQGQPMTLRQWTEAAEDNAYRVLAQDVVGDAWVSTIWTGITINLEGPPEIFETLLAQDDSSEIFRWSTEAEALEKHCAIVGALRARRAGLN